VATITLTKEKKEKEGGVNFPRFSGHEVKQLLDIRLSL
jgi:hypothetical protein